MPGGDRGVSTSRVDVSRREVLDPPKETAGPAIAALRENGVAVKVLTGDNEIVSTKICREVGLELASR